MIRLSVPFHEKDEAKKLGAKWNAQGQFWYIMNDQDITLFYKWLQNENAKINIKSATYYIAKSFRNCWKCNYKSKVYAIILPKNNLFKNRYAKILSYVTYLSKETQKYFNFITNQFYYDYSNVTNSSYWMNHCQECKARLGDFETIEEYTSPFFAKTIPEAKNITLYFVDERLEASGEYSTGIPFLEQMTIMQAPLCNQK